VLVESPDIAEDVGARILNEVTSKKIWEPSSGSVRHIRVATESKEKMEVARLAAPDADVRALKSGHNKKEPRAKGVSLETALKALSFYKLYCALKEATEKLPDNGVYIGADFLFSDGNGQEIGKPKDAATAVQQYKKEWSLTPLNGTSGVVLARRGTDGFTRVIFGYDSAYLILRRWCDLIEGKDKEAAIRFARPSGRASTTTPALRY